MRFSQVLLAFVLMVCLCTSATYAATKIVNVTVIDGDTQQPAANALIWGGLTYSQPSCCIATPPVKPPTYVICDQNGQAPYTLECTSQSACVGFCVFLLLAEKDGKSGWSSPIVVDCDMGRNAAQQDSITIELFDYQRGAVCYYCTCLDSIPEGAVTEFGHGAVYMGDGTICDSVICSGPIPALSEWGYIVLLLLLLAASVILIRRRKAESAQ